MESFLSRCPGLLRRTRIMIMFRLGCLCLDHGELDLREANFGSSSGIGDGPDLSEIMEPVPSYLLLGNPECKIFNDASFVTDCKDLFEGFAGTGNEHKYNTRTYIDFSDKDEVLNSS